MHAHLLTDICVTLPQVQYSALWENLEEAAKEVLHCPRCSHAVVDVHGICRYCRETAFQVRASHSRTCIHAHCQHARLSKPRYRHGWR